MFKNNFNQSPEQSRQEKTELFAQPSHLGELSALGELSECELEMCVGGSFGDITAGLGLSAAAGVSVPGLLTVAVGATVALSASASVG